MMLSLLSRGRAELPDLYLGAVRGSVGSARPGVDVTLLTDTHLVETCRGLVVSSIRLPHSARLTDLRLVVGQQRDVRYLVLRDGVLQVLGVAPLGLIKEYHQVENLELGDFHHNGRRLVKISQVNGGVILTDGLEEYEQIDADTSISSLEEENEGNQEVLNVIHARLEHISEAVDAARAGMEAKEKMIEETLTNLLLDTGVDTELVVGEAKETESCEAVRVTDHWLRLDTSDSSLVVLGLKLLCAGSDSVTDLSLSLQPLPDKTLDYNSSLLSLSGPASVTRLAWKMAGGQFAYLVSVLPLSSLVSTSSLSASVSYSLADLHKTTKTVHIELPANIFLSSSVQFGFSGQEEDIRSLVSLSVIGRTETLKVRTESGSVVGFVDHLENNNFVYSCTICSHVLNSPGHVLHHSLVTVTPISAQQISLSITARDLTRLGLLVNLLRKFLPSDAEFTRIHKSVSEL